jgi:erythronate-4-phosphate dehydrogenase
MITFDLQGMVAGRKISAVVDEAIPFIRGVLEPHASVVYLPGSEISTGNLKHADTLIIRTRTLCNSSLLADTVIRFIGTATIGYDHIDTRWCRKKGITWAAAPGCNSGSVTQYMVATLLHLCLLSGREPAEFTLGVVGAGHVGCKVTAAARALGMRTLVNDPPRQRREKSDAFSSLKVLLRESDIITLHVPLTVSGRDATFHLAGRDFIGSLKRGAYLINTSRGGVADEEEIKRSLWSGRLGGYIADVWTGEPAADSELIGMAKIATPHIAGYSADGKLNGTRIILRELSDYFSLPLSLPDHGVLPVPGNPVITLPGIESGTTEALHGLVRETYDIESESRRFKSSPGMFESLRNNYSSTRREFHAYSITGAHPASVTAVSLGFRKE